MITTKENSAFEVLRLFAAYGFRKSSMGDIAKAAGLSRQSIYNQFGSKEAVLDWAVGTMLEHVTQSAVDCLKAGDGTPVEVLTRAFQAWIGDHVPLIRGTPHGAEILDGAIASAAKSSRNYEQEFLSAVAGFLQSNNAFPDKDKAQDVAFVLHVASKGLLLKSETSDAFEADMSRVIQTLLDPAQVQ